jgi:prepilin-type N-terminal cleavage/methylation domain-containing protein
MSREKRTMNKNNKGFTIIELLIATTIFSIVLIVIVSSFLQIGRMFYKGVSIDNVNEASRNLVDSITSDARLTTYFDPGGVDSTNANKHFFCVGPHRYTYILALQVRDSNIKTNANSMVAGIVQDTTNGACKSPTDLPIAKASQILGPDMQLNDINIQKNTAGNTLMIRTHVVFYGSDNTVFDTNDPALANTAANPGRASTAPDAFCSGNVLSTQFCATSHLETNVTLRK